jgi:type IV secretory pathway TraG/TraD family ATPase VirD4
LAPLIAVPSVLIASVVVAIASPLLRVIGISNESVLQVAFGIAAFIGVGYATGCFLARAPTSGSPYRRGAFVAHENSIDEPHQTRHPRRTGGVSDSNTSLSLAGIPIAKEDETKHFKFIGTTGTGKSTAIREILSSALARGDRAVVADPDGGYLNNFYDASRGDVILNPFSPEGAKWNLLDEITNDYDVDQLARSLIPDNGAPDRTWSEHARAFFIAVTQQVVAARIKDDAELYRFLTKASVRELKTLLAGTSAGPLLEDGNERMFGSVRATASSAVRALKYTTRQRAPSFSVRNWVRQGSATHLGGRGGVLFIPYKAGEIAALRSIISAWIRIAIFEAMDLGERDQRLWFVVDELDALGEIDGLKDALARLRKFGGRTIIGFQSIAQVSGTYGKAAADTIVENCGNTLILRCSASERGGTSEFASKLIGQREVMHTTRSVSRRTTEWLASTTTTSQQLRIEPAIMASEIERLADLEGFLKIASVPDWKRVRLTPVSYPERITPVSAAADAPAPAAAPATLSNSAEPPAAPVTPAKRRATVVKRPRKRKNDVTRAPGAGGEDTKSGSNGAGPGDTVTAVGSNGAADKGPGSGTEFNN